MTLTRNGYATPWLLSAFTLLANCGTNQSSQTGTETASAARGGAGGVATGSAGRVLGSAGASSESAGRGGGGGGGMSATGAGGSVSSVSAGGVVGAGSGMAGVAGLGTAGSGVVTGGLSLMSVAVPTNGSFAPANTCMGADTSPDLEWTTPLYPPQSYAVTLADAATGMPQWIVWDIPASVTSLPAALDTSALLAMPAGAKQVSLSGNGYQGPCPASGQGFYLFTIFSLPVATLAGVTTTSTLTAVATAINLTPPLDLVTFGASVGMPVSAAGSAGQ